VRKVVAALQTRYGLSKRYEEKEEEEEKAPVDPEQRTLW
jgi:hypothetical protein